MTLPALFVFLLLGFAASALLVRTLLLPANRSVAGIALLVLWLCTLIMPVQWLASLELIGLSPRLQLRHLLFWSGLVLAGACAIHLRRIRRSPLKEQRTPASFLRRAPLPLHVSLGLLIALCVYGILAARALFTFPDAWDAVAYHFPVALRWLQDGTMRITSLTNWRASLPGNAEILDLLVLSTGRERFLGWVQWPAVFILLLACLRLGRRLGESAAWPVATTALMIPMVAFQSVSGHVDLFGAALLFGSLTLVLEYCDRLANDAPTARPGWLLAAGLASGLSVGAKPVFWPFALLLFLNTLVLLSRRSRDLGRRLWSQPVLFLAGAAAPSIFWFARAAGCTGNPFYPLSVHIGPFALPGVRPSEITAADYYLASVRHWTEWFVYPWTEWKRFNGLLHVNYADDSGLGGAFATFVAPGLFFAAWLAGRRRPDLRVWLANLGALGLLWWFLLGKVSRFALPVFVLAALVSAPFFETLELRATRLYKLLYVLVFVVTGAALAFEPLYAIAQTVRHGYWSRAAYWGYPAIIDELPPGSGILSLCQETLNFALAGSGLANRVIPSWERPPLLTADFLRSRRVDFVVQKSLREDGRPPDNTPPVEGLALYFSGSVTEGGKAAEWRIWSASKLRDDSLGPIRPALAR